MKRSIIVMKKDIDGVFKASQVLVPKTQSKVKSPIRYPIRQGLNMDKIIDRIGRITDYFTIFVDNIERLKYGNKR